jgi:adenylylsulfate reductase subunit A
MQSVMDKYAGGIGAGYRYSADTLRLAARKIARLRAAAQTLRCGTPRGLLYVCELRERLTVCRALLAHLGARKETRFAPFTYRTDYPAKDAKFDCLVNSRLINGRIRIFLRPKDYAAVTEAEI